MARDPSQLFMSIIATNEGDFEVAQRPRYAEWLTSWSQAQWMAGNGLIDDLLLLNSTVMTRYSQQHPKGYSIVRVQARVLVEENELLGIGPKFVPGDISYEATGGYDNEWKWFDEKPWRMCNDCRDPMECSSWQTCHHTPIPNFPSINLRIVRMEEDSIDLDVELGLSEAGKEAAERILGAKR